MPTMLSAACSRKSPRGIHWGQLNNTQRVKFERARTGHRRPGRVSGRGRNRTAASSAGLPACPSLTSVLDQQPHPRQLSKHSPASPTRKSVPSPLPLSSSNPPRTSTMIASIARRFSLTAPRFTPPAGSLAKTTSSMSPSSSRRVGMMPTSKQETPVNEAGVMNGGPAKGEAAAATTHSTSFDEMLTVGSVSSHCDGQKVNRAAEGAI